MALPAGARRLFPHYLSPADGESEPDAADALPFRTARLLEDGDSADLRAFFQGDGSPSFSPSDLGDWLALHGGRQLSRRSLAFWEWVLDRSAAGSPEERGARTALWTL